MRHVSLDQVAGSEGTAKRQFTRQDSRSNDAGKTAGVVSRVGGVRSSNTEQLQHRALRVQNGASTESADF